MPGICKPRRGLYFALWQVFPGLVEALGMCCSRSPVSDIWRRYGVPATGSQWPQYCPVAGFLEMGELTSLKKDAGKLKCGPVRSEA